MTRTTFRSRPPRAHGHTNASAHSFECVADPRNDEPRWSPRWLLPAGTSRRHGKDSFDGRAVYLRSNRLSSTSAIEARNAALSRSHSPRPIRHPVMRVKVIAGWSVTVLLVLAVVSGGVAELVHRPDNVAGIVHLGYPEYLATLLGAGKLLGAVAIVTPGFPVLREWAYAGVFFNVA